MKVLHLARFTGNKSNGIRNVVPYLVLEQSKYIDVLFQNTTNVKIEECANFQIEFDLNSWEKKCLVEEKIDLVVFHGIYHIEMVKIAKILVKYKIPYIIAPHGSLKKTALKQKWLKKFVANVLIFNKFINNASSIQFLSIAEKEESKVLPPSFIVSNGVYLPSKFKTEFNKNLKIVFVGRKDIYFKGLDILLDSVNIIKDYLVQNEVKIYLYGSDKDGGDKVLNDIIIDKELQSVVEVYDAVFGLDKEKVLLNSDMFIQTSRSEGMPMGILEALSYGLPCLITKGTSLGDIVDKYDAGWVAETNAVDISRKIKQMIQDKESYSVKGENAIKLIKENFIWDIIAKQSIEAYKKLLGE